MLYAEVQEISKQSLFYKAWTACNSIIIMQVPQPAEEHRRMASLQSCNDLLGDARH